MCTKVGSGRCTSSKKFVVEALRNQQPANALDATHPNLELWLDKAWTVPRYSI